MASAALGNVVKIHYTGKLADGTVFDSSLDREPLQFTVGEAQVLEGFERCVVGMNPGDTRSIQLPAREAYGLHRDDLVMEADREQFPEDLELEVGIQIQMEEDDGRITVVTVIRLDEKTITLDANHPLAGMDLTFEITLVKVVAGEDS